MPCKTISIFGMPAMTAGTGTDAAPYFRIFNPALQNTKFGPEGEYICKWVPELRGVNSRNIHAPWAKGIGQRNIRRN